MWFEFNQILIWLLNIKLGKKKGGGGEGWCPCQNALHVTHEAMTNTWHDKDKFRMSVVPYDSPIGCSKPTQLLAK